MYDKVNPNRTERKCDLNATRDSFFCVNFDLHKIMAVLMMRQILTYITKHYLQFRQSPTYAYKMQDTDFNIF